MIKHVSTFIFALFLISLVSAQQSIFSIVEKQENSLIVEFTLPNYQLFDYKIINGEMHQKLMAKEAVTILKKGFHILIILRVILKRPYLKSILILYLMEIAIITLLDFVAYQYLMRKMILF